MMQSLWKKLFIAVTVLLVISFVLDAGLWYQLNVTKSQLNDTIARLDAVKPEMDSLKVERDRVVSGYADLREQINLRLGMGQDSQSFITPDEPEISARVQEITGGYSEEKLWKDYAHLFQWVMRNIKYSLDSPTPLLPESVDGTLEWAADFWRTPVQTISDGTGDCEDIALLLTSLLLNYNQRRYPAWIVGVKTTGDQPRAHVAVAIPSENNQLSFFDIPGRYYTPFSTVGGFGSQDVPLAVDHWLNHLEEEMLGAQIYVVFSESFYQEFSGNEEFIDWASLLLTPR
ncbi:MAG: transglutaminase-like domain-containing protein [Dehalococcoidales bacterium]